MRGEYYSAKCQLHNWEGGFGAIAPPWRENLFFIKEYKSCKINSLQLHPKGKVK